MSLVNFVLRPNFTSIYKAFWSDAMTPCILKQRKYACSIRKRMIICFFLLACPCCFTTDEVVCDPCPLDCDRGRCGRGEGGKVAWWLMWWPGSYIIVASCHTNNLWQLTSSICILILWPVTNNFIMHIGSHQPTIRCPFLNILDVKGQKHWYVVCRL